jgi:predicted membrane channel-forming protein YqfA (hemolysin III family)
MENGGRWLVGFMVAFCGLFSLYLASRAEDPVMYYSGIVFFVASVLFNFWQIKQVYDEKSEAGGSGH